MGGFLDHTRDELPGFIKLNSHGPQLHFYNLHPPILSDFYKEHRTQQASLLFTEQFIDLPHPVGHMAPSDQEKCAGLQSMSWEGGSRNRREHGPCSPECSLNRGSHLTPLDILVLLCHGWYVSDKASTDGPVAISKGEALAFF